MITAVLYSDQVIPANARIDRRLLALVGGCGATIGYVPSGPDPAGRFFEEKKVYYAQYGLELAVRFDPVSAPTAADRAALLSCDAIHLSGGHTKGFLTRLRQWGMMDVLRQWTRDGGVLIGTSAGAILMTPTIALDALFSGGDPEAVADGDALDLLPFEFFPHLQADEGYLDAVRAYSRRNGCPVVACADGDGVVVAEGRIEAIGAPLLIRGGTVEPMHDMALPDRRA